MTDLQKSIDQARSARLWRSILKAGETLETLAAPTDNSGSAAAPPAAPEVAPDLMDPDAPGTPTGPTTHVDFQGIPVEVDRPRGFVMNGVDAKGVAWKRAYYVDYGFIPNTQGGDGMGLDVFLGLEPDAPEAHWILQKKDDGTFDEYKLMLGFSDPEKAKAMYAVHVPKRYFDSMVSTSIGTVKALLNIPPTEALKMLKGMAGLPVLEETRVDRSVKLLKSETDAELRYVLGIVLVPEEVDGQGDIYSAEEIRRAEWNYMADFRNIGHMHKALVNGKVRLVESFIAPLDMELDGSTIKKGTWLMGLNVVDDALWSKCKAGDLTGLSIGGFASKTPV